MGLFDFLLPPNHHDWRYKREPSNPYLDLGDDNPFEPETVRNIRHSFENVKKATSPTERLSDFIVSYTLEDALKKLEKGDHVKANRTVYSHHAIYIGYGKVIEYNDYVIKESSLADFADGDYIIKVNDRAKYSRAKIVERARSRLGEENYNILWNNCENFADWCRNGD